MANSFGTVCKGLSVVAALALLFFSARLVAGHPVRSDILRSAAFALYAVSFGLNLFRLSKVRAMMLAALHAVGVVYLANTLVDMTLIALGEAGRKPGLWGFFSPLVFLLVALLASVIFNLARAKGLSREGS